MTRQFFKGVGVFLLAGTLALAGCSGEDGGPGAPGRDGTDGTNGQDLTASAKPESCAVCHPDAGSSHQAIYNKYTDASTLALTIEKIESIADGAGTFDSTMTVVITKNGAPYIDNELAGLEQKRFYAFDYDATTRKFIRAINYTGKPAHQGNGRYTITATKAPFAPESSDAQAYAYLADEKLPSEGMELYNDVASAAKTFSAAVDAYVSAASVSGCEKCHGTPYLKHGYRAAKVAGLPDFAACKACHTDLSAGGHQGWQLLVDDPAAYAAQNGVLTDAQKTKYAYKKSVMNDVHMSHAMEFAYPQSMANCVTCHEGKLASLLTEANFTLETCKSCHPVTGVGGTDPKRAPALKTIVPSFHGSLEPYTGAACNSCHKDGGAVAFSAIHSGRTASIYDNSGTRFADSVKTTVEAVSFDAATNKLTVDFKMTGLAANALVKPTLVVSLYGYDTKDFVVSGHGSQSDGTTNLEYTYGAKQRSDPTKSSNSARLTLSPEAPTAGTTSWTAVADFSLWADKIGAGKQVQRVEIAFLPAVGRDQAAAISATNPAIAVSGKTATVDLVAGALVADANSYGKKIVDPAKCNKCHEALGTTFHNPNYGSAGVVACRTCHVVGSGGGHLEMQSRSIDSYVHAIHSFQAFDIGGINFADQVESMRYDHHVESTYPNFTILNCESCHYSGTYEVPDQAKSLPSVLSAAAAVTTKDRAIGAVPSYVTGPASRACGSCHRAEMINEDKAGELAAFNEHTATFGTLLNNGTGVFDAAVAKIMALFK